LPIDIFVYITNQTDVAIFK